MCCVLLCCVCISIPKVPACRISVPSDWWVQWRRSSPTLNQPSAKQKINRPKTQRLNRKKFTARLKTLYATRKCLSVLLLFSADRCPLPSALYCTHTHTQNDIFGGVSRSPEKTNSPGTSPALKPWNNRTAIPELCIAHYLPPPPPQQPIKLNSETPVAPTVPHKPATASATDEKSNKENVKPSGSCASSAAAAELSAENETARLSAEEERLLEEAREYFGPKVDADGALVLGRADINPAKWKVRFLVCSFVCVFGFFVTKSVDTFVLLSVVVIRLSHCI